MSRRDGLNLRKEESRDYSDFTNVKKIHEDLIPEEFPEGSFGSPINVDKPISGKSAPWEKGQRRQSAYIYPYKAIHDNLPRRAPGAHPIHDDPNHKE